MNIAIINGSPKGKYSITLQTCLYLQKLFPEHEYNVLHVGQQIRKFEKDMSEAVDALASADLVLFSYPVYTFIATSQLHRFIELVKQNGIDLSGKFATQITTSKHFYDVTAHRYIEDNCADLKMKFIKGLSADMDDLTTKKGQKEAVEFFKYACFCVSNDLFETPSVSSESKTVKYKRQLQNGVKYAGRDTVIVADFDSSDKSLIAMIEDFQAAFVYPTRIVNIREYPFSGGCLGCFKCASNGKCVYKDGFDTFLRENIQKADSIVFAFNVKDHSMGARFKMYDDRQFCNGHRTVTSGMPMGYIVCGKLENEENLRTIIEARCDVGGNLLCGIATDCDTIKKMASRLEYAMDNSLVKPQSFYGIGGMMIFRDLIYIMRGLMKADHRFYKEHGVYDTFPQKKKGRMLAMMLVGSLMNNEKLMSKAGNSMNEGMLMPYKKVLDELDK